MNDKIEVKANVTIYIDSRSILIELPRGTLYSLPVDDLKTWGKYNQHIMVDNDKFDIEIVHENDTYTNENTWSPPKERAKK